MDTSAHTSRATAIVCGLAILLAGGIAGRQSIEAQEKADQEAVSHSGSRVSPLLRARMAMQQPAAQPNKNYHGSIGNPLPLNILWRVRVNGTDRMITIDPAERDSYPFEGAIFYLPKLDVPGAGLIPLYRLYNGCCDHTVSTNPNEGKAEGYHPEGILGYAFSSSTAGASQLIRTFNATTKDYSLRNSTGLDNESGYTDEPMGIYGDTRYYNRNAQLLALSGGGVTVASNLAAGGVLWHWTWNGVQVINNYGYGRQIQTDIFTSDYANPTEAGDTWSLFFTRPGQNHGSPTALAQNNGLTQSTRSIPIDFDPDGTQQCVFQPPPGPCPGFGGGPDNPVLWREVVLGKDLTLNFNNLGPVALYTTIMQVPKALDSGSAREIPVLYARKFLPRIYLRRGNECAPGDRLHQRHGLCTQLRRSDRHRRRRECGHRRLRSE